MVRPSPRPLVAALIAILLAAVSPGSIAATLPVQSSTASSPVVVVPCAPTADAPLVLLAQRVLLQTWSGGQTQSPPTIPNWAGQWGTIAGSAFAGGRPPVQTASQLFLAQTGVTLPSLANATVQADSSDFELFQYVFVPLTQAQLTELVDDVNQAIATNVATEGVLSTVAAVSSTEALLRMGPVPAPPNGWSSFLVEEAYGGQEPGALDVTFPILVQLITSRTTMSDEIFQEALLLLPSACTTPQPPSP